MITCDIKLIFLSELLITDKEQREIWGELRKDFLLVDNLQSYTAMQSIHSNNSSLEKERRKIWKEIGEKSREI